MDEGYFILALLYIWHGLLYKTTYTHMEKMDCQEVKDEFFGNSYSKER